MEMDAKGNTSWLRRNIYARTEQWGKTTHAHNQHEQKENIYKTPCTLQRVYKQMQDESQDELHFETIRVPIWTSVPLKEARKSQWDQNFILRITIQLDVEKNGLERNIWFEHEFHISALCADSLTWTI